MATAEQMEVQRAGNARIRGALSADLNRFWGSVDLADRDGVREAVLALSPALVDRFGAMSAALSAGFFEDTVNARRLPGEGAFDVPAFIAAIHRAGYRGHWGVEIISEQHRKLPLREGLTRARTTTLQALEAADALVASSG